MSHFQAISWESNDQPCKIQDITFLEYPRNDTFIRTLYHPIFDSQKNGNNHHRIYTVEVSGRTISSEFIQHSIIGFRPYFYVHVERFLPNTIEKIVELISKAHPTCEITLVRKIQFVGFHETEENFLRIDFASRWSFQKTKYLLRNQLPVGIPELFLFESMCEPIVQFWIAFRIHPMTWIESNDSSGTKVHVSNLTFHPNDEHLAPFRVIHYDLECFSSVAWNTGKNQMPNPDIREDVIIGIGCVLTNTISPEIQERLYIGISPISPPQNDDTTKYVSCESEEEMLREFINYIMEKNPDVWNAFNNFGFDDNYLFTRMKRYELEESFPRRTNENVCVRSKTFASNAFQFEAKYLHHPLRVYMDLLTFARREFKTEMTKFTLENVSQVLLNKGKHDVSPQEIFRAWAELNPLELGRVGAYCVQDCALVAEIMSFKQVYSTLFSRSELFLLDPRDLLLKGQQQIVFNLLFQQVRTQTNFCIPDSADDAIDNSLEFNSDSDDSESDSDDDDPHAHSHTHTYKYKRRVGHEKFKGATVLEPKKGPYMVPITGLDFASLYPSIMVAYNLCHSTRILTSSTVPKEQLYTTELTGGRTTTFVQKDYRRGVLPQILLNLWGMRKSLKKLMGKAKENRNINLTAVYNAKQLAVKVAMNSIYGFCGAELGGKLPMKDIAETVTANGRMLIERSKNYAESWYPCEVVYGDTDSIYVRFFLDELPEHLQNPQNDTDRTEMLQWVFKRSQECADRITENYISPIELEFEKVMYPFILFKKKRYCCLIFEKPHEIDELCMKGISPTRRDYAPIVKRVYEHILNLILYERNINGAFEYAEIEVMKLLNGEVPINELVLSRSISRKPEMYANQNVPHLVLARKLEERTGVSTKVGDRVQFVFIRGTGRQCDLVEDPSTARPEEIDGSYYFEHQLKNSLTEILGTLDSTRWESMKSRLEKISYRKQKGLQDISSFFTSNSTSNSTSSTNVNSNLNSNVNAKKKMKTVSIESFFIKK
jgi:DNA polymerase delta subunit 1